MRKLYANEPVILNDLNPVYGMPESKAYELFMFDSSSKGEQVRSKSPDGKFSYLYTAQGYAKSKGEQYDGKLLPKEYSNYYHIINE